MLERICIEGMLFFCISVKRKLTNKTSVQKCEIRQTKRPLNGLEC